MRSIGWPVDAELTILDPEPLEVSMAVFVSKHTKKVDKTNTVEMQMLRDRFVRT